MPAGEQGRINDFQMSEASTLALTEGFKRGWPHFQVVALDYGGVEVMRSSGAINLADWVQEIQQQGQHNALPLDASCFV